MGKEALTAAQKIRSKWAALAAALVVLVVLALVITSLSFTEAARESDEFVDSIGVNTHLHFLDGPYGDRYPLVREKLSDLGVRHARNGGIIAPSPAANDLFYGRLRELAQEEGVHFTLSLDPRRQNLGSVDEERVGRVARMAGPALESFEGPNELNKEGGDWASTLAAYQEDLYRAVKSNPSTSDVPVLGPAIAKPYPSIGEVPDLSAYSDYANMHSYPGGRNPNARNLDNESIPLARKIGGNDPIVATETGYTNALAYGDHHRPVSERAMGKYVPRLLFEYFNRGVQRTYLYELMDQGPDPDKDERDDNFGLLRYDGTEKPAYGALENLIGLLEDPGPRFETGSLDYSLGDEGVKNIHHTLLQKRDGRFYLVLWQEVSSYNRDTERDLYVEPQRVQLTLDEPIKAANLYQPNRSASRIKTYTAPERITLDVPDELLVIELVPSD